MYLVSTVRTHVVRLSIPRTTAPNKKPRWAWISDYPDEEMAGDLASACGPMERGTLCSQPLRVNLGEPISRLACAFHYRPRSVT
jgi:hypothetical protein